MLACLPVLSVRLSADNKVTCPLPVQSKTEVSVVQMCPKVENGYTSPLSKQITTFSVIDVWKCLVILHRFND